jgi:uncharacterized membrane protein YfcA
MTGVLGMSVGLLLACMATVFLGGVVQGLFGYGLGLLLLPLLAILSPRSLPQVVLLLGLPTVAWMAVHERRSINVASVRWLVVGRVLGTGLGLVALAVLAESALQIAFGAVTALMVVGTMLGSRRIDVNSRTSLVAGGFSGVMSTTAGVGGPPIAMLYSRRAGPELRSTLSVVLFLGAVMSLVGVVAIGRVTLSDLLVVVACFPALAVGMLASRSLVTRVSTRVFRILLLALSLVSGLLVIVLVLTGAS